MDRDEEEPRAIRERWSVFINSVLENFPTGRGGSTDEWVREEARRTESVRKNEEKKRSDGESSTCSKSRPDAHANLYPGVEPPNEGTRNLRSGAARETVVSNRVISPWDRHCVREIKTFQFSTGVQRLPPIPGTLRGYISLLNG